MDKQILLHEEIKKELSRLERALANMEKMLQELPKGSIYEKNGKYYHVYRVKGKQRMRAIKDTHLLNQLRIKRHIEACLPQIVKRIQNCRTFLMDDELYDIKATSLQLPERYRNVHCDSLWLPGDIDPEEWGRAEYEQNPKPIKKPSTTDGGRIVRSKSEAIIGSQVEGVPLIHRYEPKMVLFGEVFYPDFMFILPHSRRLVIWEHFGMMDDPEYVEKAMHKLEAYSRAGWVLGRDFFVTYEMECMPFSFAGAKAKLAEILATDRVDW